MFISTRSKGEQVSAATAIKKGIASDGGLFVPETVPHITVKQLEELIHADYQQRAVAILKLFLTDYTQQELNQAVARAYGDGKFNHPKIAPLVKVVQSTHVLELWHGPTSAFKDMALQLLPQLLAQAMGKTGENSEIVILVATSGDTGKAALEGFQDVDKIKIIVFYPNQGVSKIQGLQMVTQQGSNVSVIGVDGNFDDAQTGVKEIFNNEQFNAELGKLGYKLSSANSINWGRLVPQIVYYFSAYLDLVAQGEIKVGDPVDFVVPTGNFGNILAGYYAKLMGLPVNKLICASNSNNVLTDFLITGEYNRKRPFHKTISPSMDILISSNLERLLYLVTDGDVTSIKTWMEELQSKGSYRIPAKLQAKIQDTFTAYWADDKLTTDKIKAVFTEYGYLLDPHTAVAWQAADEYKKSKADQSIPTVIISTASPFKFNDSVLTALTGKTAGNTDEFTLLEELSKLTGAPVPKNLSSLSNKPVRHKGTCAKDKMPETVKAVLELLKKEAD